MTTRLELGLETRAAASSEAEARERRTVLVPGMRIALLVLANVIGLLAFLWPFVLPSVASHVAENHQGDGPWIVAALGAILLALLFLELGRGGLGPKTVALLGVLGAAMVALRLPGFVAGFSALFIVVLVAGNSLGPGFGFLLGCVGMFASGIFVGGLGPWLPFEMVAVGWGRRRRGTAPARWIVAGPGRVARRIRVRERVPLRPRDGALVLAVPHRRLRPCVGPGRGRVDERPALPRVLRGRRV